MTKKKKSICTTISPLKGGKGKYDSTACLFTEKELEDHAQRVCTTKPVMKDVFTADQADKKTTHWLQGLAKDTAKARMVGKQTQRWNLPVSSATLDTAAPAPGGASTSFCCLRLLRTSSVTMAMSLTPRALVSSLVLPLPLSRVLVRAGECSGVPDLLRNLREGEVTEAASAESPEADLSLEAREDWRLGETTAEAGSTKSLEGVLSLLADRRPGEAGADSTDSPGRVLSAWAERRPGEAGTDSANSSNMFPSDRVALRPGDAESALAVRSFLGAPPPLGGAGPSLSITDVARTPGFSAPCFCLAGDTAVLSGVLECRPDRLEGKAGSAAAETSGVPRCRVERLAGDFGASFSSNPGVARRVDRLLGDLAASASASGSDAVEDSCLVVAGVLDLFDDRRPGDLGTSSSAAAEGSSVSVVAVLSGILLLSTPLSELSTEVSFAFVERSGVLAFLVEVLSGVLSLVGRRDGEAGGGIISSLELSVCTNSWKDIKESVSVFTFCSIFQI